MKKILIGIITLFVAFSSFSASSGGSPTWASQPEANIGAIPSKGITPQTLLNYSPGVSGVYGYGTVNILNNQSQYRLWQNTNNVFCATPPNGTNGFMYQEIGQSNTVWWHNGGGYGVVAYPLNLTNRGNGRFISTVTIPASGLTGGSGFIAGFATNAYGVCPTDNQKIFGFAAIDGQGQSGHGFLYYRSSGFLDYPAWGTSVWTNGTYNMCISSDQSNVSCVIVWPGHTNEARLWIPWDNLHSGFSLSNFVAGLWFGQQAVLEGAGGRTNNTQTFNPRRSVEGRTDFVHYTDNTNGDKIRVVIPAQYDSATNIGNLMVFVHGNTGNERGTFDSLDGEGTSAGTVNYWNGLVTNGFIVASYCGDFTSPGKTDTWGTQKGQDSIQATINWVRQRYAFSNIFLWLESAGGFTGCNYIASKREKIAGVIMNHAGFDLAAKYPTQTSDINTAYGGSTAAQFAGFDPAALSVTAFAGVPFRITSSSGDTIVPKATQTDRLVTLLGGVVGSNVIGAQFTPEIDDYVVAGAAGVHGGLCITPAVMAGDIAFLNRCIGYAKVNYGSYVGEFSGIVNDLTLRNTNAAPAVTTTARWFVFTNLSDGKAYSFPAANYP